MTTRQALVASLPVVQMVERRTLADLVLTTIPRISRRDTGGRLVATQWCYTAPTPAPLIDGTPPTGRTVAYPGASFVQVEGDKIRSEHVYVDRQPVAEQLGLKSKASRPEAQRHRLTSSCER